MRLAVDVRTMGSRPSGIGMYTYNFLCELAKYPDVELMLISDVDTSEQMQTMKKKQIPIYLYGKQVFRSAEVFRYFHFVHKILKQKQPDLFWEPNNLMPKSMNGFKGKIILTVHDIFPITTPQYFGMLYRLYFQMMLKRSLKTADAILYDSQFSENEVETIYPFIKEKPHFLSYVIIKLHDDTFQKKQAACQDNQINEKSGTPYFLYIGNIEQRKGTDLLLKAYNQYRNHGGTYRLLLGGGIKGNGMEELLKDAMQQDTLITYMGYINDEQKKVAIQNCEVFVFPTKAEGFGMPLIEVMEYQKPIIARALPIFCELVGDCVCYFPIRDEEEKEVSDFAKKMMEAEKNGILFDEDAYHETLSRYDATKLGAKLVEYLRKL